MTGFSNLVWKYPLVANLSILMNEPPGGPFEHIENVPHGNFCQFVHGAPLATDFSNFVWDCPLVTNFGIKLGSVPWWPI